MTFFEVERVSDTDTRIKNILLNVGGGTEEVYIGSDTEYDIAYGEKALFTATDYFVKQLYTGERGLHLFATPKAERFTTHIGYIAHWCACDDQPYPLPNYGWSPLWKTGEMYELPPFEDEEHERNTTMKHNIIDLFLTGKVLKVRVLHRQNLVKSALAIWDPKSKKAQKEELAKGARSLAATIAADRVSGRKQERVRSYKGQAVTRRVQSGNTMIKVKGDQPVDLYSLPAGDYTTFNARGVRQTVEPWVPGKTDYYWKNFITSGWQIELPAVNLYQ